MMGIWSKWNNFNITFKTIYTTECIKEEFIFSVLEKIVFLFMDLRMSYVKRQVCLKKNANIDKSKDMVKVDCGCINSGNDFDPFHTFT